MKRNHSKIAAIVYLSICAVILGSAITTGAAVNPVLISSAPNGDNGTGDSRNASVSGDGRYVVFESDATNLVSGLTDTNNFSDIFLRDTRNGTLRCISLANATTTGNALSVSPIISASGRYIVFASKASDLVPGTDTNFDYDVFRFDTVTNQTQLISANVSGKGTGNNLSGFSTLYLRTYDMSDDGRFVAFTSNASDLNGISDTNGKSDIFVRDTQNNLTRLASINKNANASGNNESVFPSISADGNMVAYTSSSSDLIPIDNNSTSDVFVYNLQFETTKCASLSVSNANVTGSFSSVAPVISKNGTRVAYFSNANDLTSTPIPLSNLFRNVFVHDLGFGSTTLVSINTAGTASGNEESGNGIPHQLNLSISPNGRYIAFESKAGNLVPDTPPAGGTYNVFRRDLTLARTELVSFNSVNAVSGNGPSTIGLKDRGMSDDARFITFTSVATNLAPDLPGNSISQIYVRDMVNRVTTALTMNSAGTALSTGGKSLPGISADGRAVVFDSISMDLAATNTHNTQNIFKSFVPTPQEALSDFDGDGRTDFAVFRPSQGAWYVLNSDATFAHIRLYGTGTDNIVPADYTGDGRTDYAVFRPSSGMWYISDSLNFTETSVHFGQAGDKPVPQDYDGDGKTDVAIYRAGGWWWLSSRTGQVNYYQFGLATDIPVHGDFDGDGKADYAVFRPSDGNWYVLKSSNGVYYGVHFGQNGDKPVPADCDGDGKTDTAIFRDGAWWILNSLDNGVRYVQWGLATDIPVAASYDGDGKADIAVFRPSEGNWYVLRSTSGAFLGLHFGQNGDKPAPAAFIQ